MIVFCFPGCEGEILFTRGVYEKCLEDVCIKNEYIRYMHMRWVNQSYCYSLMSETETEGYVVNPLYPYNIAYYLSEKDYDEEKEIIVCPLDFSVLDILKERFFVSFVLCYPEGALKSEYAERLKNSKAYSEKYVAELLVEWDSMINKCLKLDGIAKVELKAGETIVDRWRDIWRYTEVFDPDPMGWRLRAIQVYRSWLKEADGACGLLFDTESAVNGKQFTYKYVIPSLESFPSYASWFEPIWYICNRAGVKLRMSTIHNDIIPFGYNLYATNNRFVFLDALIKEIYTKKQTVDGELAQEISRFVEEQNRTKHYQLEMDNEVLKGAWAIKNYCKSRDCVKNPCDKCVFVSLDNPTINPNCAMANTMGDKPKEWRLPSAEYEDVSEGLRTSLAFLDDPGDSPF